MAGSFFGGAPSLSWSIANPDPNSAQRWLDNEALRGVALGGRVISVGDPTQQIEMQSGKPQWWQEPNPAQGIAGRPKMNIAVVLRCDGTCGGRDLRNPENPTDTGDRTLYVPDYGDLNKAIKAAFVLAGDDDLKVGAVLLVAWLGYRPSKRQNMNPARTFAAKYERAPSGLATGQADGSQVQPPPGAMPLTQQPDGRYAPVHTGGLPAQPAQQPAAVADTPFGGPSQQAPATGPLQPTGGQAPNPFA